MKGRCPCGREVYTVVEDGDPVDYEYGRLGERIRHDCWWERKVARQRRRRRSPQPHIPALVVEPPKKDEQFEKSVRELIDGKEETG